MKIKCVIIDDEPLAIKVIENHLKEFQNFEVIGTFNNPITPLALLENGEADVLFLDINMPKMNGLDFAKTLDDALNSESMLSHCPQSDRYAITLNSLDD